LTTNGEALLPLLQVEAVDSLRVFLRIRWLGVRIPFGRASDCVDGGVLSVGDIRTSAQFGAADSVLRVDGGGIELGTLGPIVVRVDGVGVAVGGGSIGRCWLGCRCG
jgi:hypothetical protein